MLYNIWAFIARQVAGLNKKYDNMKEPGRFYIMLAVAFAPWMILDLFALISGHTGFDMFAIFWVLFLILVRFWWVAGNLRIYLENTR